jgi:hypothetical protein
MYIQRYIDARNQLYPTTIQELKEMEHKKFDETLDEILKLKYEHHMFVFGPKNRDLHKLIRDDKVPNLPGVYYFRGITDISNDVVYIGMSGTYPFKKDGKFKGQMLKGRLSNKQEKKIKRQVFFNSKVPDEYREIEIYWYVTCNKDGINGLLPAKAEADLMQAHFDDNGILPSWNKEF